MRFSVIVPLYNKAPYVQKALQSILNQTFQDFEVVVVDDGSSDDSFSKASQVLEGASAKHLLIHQNNAGVSTARNQGVASSSGEFLCFLDADDWWEPLFLERINWLITSYPNAGLYGANYYYVKNGHATIGVSGVETGIINYCRSYVSSRKMPIWTGAVCIPRHVFNEMGGFRPELKLGEDFDLWIRIAFKENVVFLNEPISNYNQDADPKWRGVGHLVDPNHHMLWNLSYLSDEEAKKGDYKRLIDYLRTYSLMPYYLSEKYHKDAQKELAKVDWSMQPKKIRRLYDKPRWYLIIRREILTRGSLIKQWIKKHI